MRADQTDDTGIVAARPRGFNGIPEPEELREPDVTHAASHRDGLRAVLPTASSSAAKDYSEWIAVLAIAGGAIAALAGCSRELRERSRRRDGWSRPEDAHPTKPHGDKLLPHGQRHW